MTDQHDVDFTYRPSFTLPDTTGAASGEDDIGDLFPVTPVAPGREVYLDDQGEAQWIVYPGEETLLTLHLDTAVHDWIDLRIRREGDAYIVRYVDTYPEHWLEQDVLILPRREFAALPTFAEILRLLDGTVTGGESGNGVTDAGLIQHFGTMQPGAETIAGRTAGMALITLESFAYPQLTGWYGAIARHYVDTGELLAMDAEGDGVRRIRVASPDGEPG